MEQTTQFMIKLIANEVCGAPLELPFDLLSDEQLVIDLFSKAREHGVLHLVADALDRNSLLGNGTASQAYLDGFYKAIYKNEQIRKVYADVCRLFEENKIPYIPLKGAVIRKLYPEEWMRSSVDIDILIHENDIKKAGEMMTEVLGCCETDSGKHDITFLSPEKVYVELHFRLIEKKHKIAATEILDSVWDYAVQSNDGSFRFELTDPFFCFYHVAHMAKHFLHGGCGIRPFLDLWLMNRNGNYSGKEAQELLRKGSLIKFYELATQLSEVWFSAAEHTPQTLRLEDYIIKGGSFGSHETRILSSHQQSGGKFRHIFNRIFIPYDELRRIYPIIGKHRFLTPVCEICRLFSLLFGKKRKFRRAYLHDLNNIPENIFQEIRTLFDSVELQ